MTIEEFERALEGLGNAISNMDDILLAAGGRLVEQMKTNAPVDTTRLRDSIAAVVENNSLKIKMLTYGAFQNYGVAGTDEDSRYGVVDEVQAGVLPPPLMSSKYQYKTKRYGIPATRFFDVTDMTDYLAEAIEENLINQL